jgi:hypothetical protein
MILSILSDVRGSVITQPCARAIVNLARINVGQHDSQF